MTVRAAVIGAGHFAYRMHIPVLAARDDVILDSVCRLGASDLERVRSEFGFEFATEAWREVLARDVDIAVIASPHDLHYEQAKAFLEKGCHVLVEKPMCLDPADAWDLVAVAQRARRELMVAYGWHYKPGLEQMRDLVARIGTVEHVVCHMASFTREVFTGEGGVGRWSHVAIQPDPATWQRPDAGGGYAYGQLSHALGLLYWLTDLRLSAVTALTFEDDRGIDLHDAAAVRFEGGATGLLSGSCGVPAGHGFEVELRVYGTEGAAILDIEAERLVLKLQGGGSEVVDAPKGAWTYSCEGPAAMLVELAHGRGRNQSPGAVGALAVETLHGMLESARSGGRPVSVGAHRPMNAARR